jgi:hypothetical protein
MPRKPVKPAKPPVVRKPPSPKPPAPQNEAGSSRSGSPNRRSSRHRLPTQKAVTFADPAAQPAVGTTPKPTRLRWGPDSGVKQRVAISQAEKSLRAAQTGAQQNAKAVEKENAVQAEQERRQRLQQMAEEAGREEEEDLPSSEDPESEIDRREEENLEFNQQIPYEYTVSWALKALIGPGPFPRRAVKWQGKVGEDWAQGQFKYNALDFELSNAMEHLGFINLVEVIVTAKSTNTRGTRKSITLEELSQESWDSKVEPLLKQEHLRFLGFKLDVIVEFFGRQKDNPLQKRAYSSIESPGKSQSPLPRRTRTVQEEERQADRRDRNEEAGELSERLLDRWTCLKDTCINHKRFCFVDYRGRHFSMDTTIRETWAKAISKGNATVERPPEALYNFWVQKGAVDETCKAPLAKASKEAREQAKEARMERLFEMQERAQEYAMEQQIRGQISALNTQQVAAAQLAPAPAGLSQQPYSYPLYPPWIQTPQSFWQMPAPAPAPTPAPAPAPALAPAPAPAPAPALALVPAAVPAQASKAVKSQSSSPIAEEEELVLEDYWVWKGSQTGNLARKAQLAAAREIVDDEMWTISQLKLMSDTSSKIFSLAISKGIPSGLAAGFRADFRRFKSIYQDQYAPARQLEQLRGEDMSGGFFR